MSISIASAKTVIIGDDSTPIGESNESEDSVFLSDVAQSDFDRLVLLTENLIKFSTTYNRILDNEEARNVLEAKKYDQIQFMFANITAIVENDQEIVAALQKESANQNKKISNLQTQNQILQDQISTMKTTAWTWAALVGGFVAVSMRIYRSLKQRGKFEALRLRIIAWWPFNTGPPDIRNAKPFKEFKL